MVDPHRVERFRSDLAALRPVLGRFGVAVSGGPDSVALLLLAQAAYPGSVEAATVDHQLRARSAEEARFVGSICAEMGVPHTILDVEVSEGNLQDRARAARYRALGGWAEERGLAAVLTAHHADDQAETVLMRLNRGSGVHGLSGVRAVTGNPHGRGLILRPLLGWRRNELAGLVQDAGIDPVADPSNSDSRFDRVRVRAALAQADWIDVLALVRSVELLAQASDVVRFAVEREYTECVVPDGEGLRFSATRTTLARATLVRIGVVEMAARQLGGSLDAAGAARMVEELSSARPCNIGGIAGRAVDREGERSWLFTKENPRRTG